MCVPVNGEVVGREAFRRGVLEHQPQRVTESRGVQLPVSQRAQSIRHVLGGAAKPPAHCGGLIGTEKRQIRLAGTRASGEGT